MDYNDGPHGSMHPMQHRCPVCGADPGQPCSDTEYAVWWYHIRRLTIALEYQN